MRKKLKNGFDKCFGPLKNRNIKAFVLDSKWIYRPQTKNCFVATVTKNAFQSVQATYTTFLAQTKLKTGRLLGMKYC